MYRSRLSFGVASILDWIASFIASDLRRAQRTPASHHQSKTAAPPSNHAVNGRIAGAASAMGVKRISGRQRLPNDIASLVEDYVDHLELAALRGPLTKFLRTAAALEGLEGIGLAVWRTPNMPPLLAMYAFTNLSRLDIIDEPSAYDAASDAFDHFAEQVDAFADYPLAVVMPFVNTANLPVGSIGDDFLAGRDYLFLGQHALGDTITKLDFADIQGAIIVAA